MNEEFSPTGGPGPDRNTPVVPPAPPVAPPPPLPQPPVAPPRGYTAPYPPPQYAPTQPYGQQPYGQPPAYTPPPGYGAYYTVPPGYPYPPQPVKKTNGLAVASLVLGILSIVFFYALFFSVLIGGLAIILGICSRRGDGKMSGLAVAGIVCGSIGLALGLLMIIALFNGVTDIRFTVGEENALSCFPFIR